MRMIAVNWNPLICFNPWIHNDIELSSWKLVNKEKEAFILSFLYALDHWVTEMADEGKHLYIGVFQLVIEKEMI